MAIETIDYYLRNNSEAFIYTMDMTKAFDNVKHSTLFEKLIKRDFPKIMIRFLMYEYEIQVANVKWNNCYSMKFNIKNGVKQGTVLSALLYCVYVDGLFHILRKSRLGCWINGEFVGIVGYADDNMLLSPTLDGLQRMINICELYAADHNLTFSTNENANKCKTKCMAILKKGRNLKTLTLGGHCLPMVNSVRHLGNKIENKLDGTRQDMQEKRARFIQKTNELCQEFSFADPITKCKLNSIYNIHFTGSPIWGLFCREAEAIEKNMECCHQEDASAASLRYFTEPLSETRHIKLALIKRFIKFTQKIANSTKTPMKTLYNCIRKECKSTTGNNLRCIMLLLDVDNIDYISTKMLEKDEIS